MPKKKKLALGDLKVQSFVTELGDEAKMAKGGLSMTICVNRTVCYCITYTCSYISPCSLFSCSCNEPCTDTCT